MSCRAWCRGCPPFRIQLQATCERHPVGAKGRRVVDHHRGGIETIRDAKRDVDVLCKDAGLESGGQGIGAFDRVVKIVVAIDRDHGAENLLYGYPYVTVRVEQHRWLSYGRLPSTLAAIAPVARSRAHDGDKIFSAAF